MNVTWNKPLTDEDFAINRMRWERGTPIHVLVAPAMGDARDADLMRNRTAGRVRRLAKRGAR